MVNNLYKMFLGDSPDWYKNTIIAFLIINPITLFVLSSLGIKATFIVGWMILLEFIFTLALALKCYPLQPGGLITIQALFLGLTTPYTLLYEIEHNLEVILLLVFMVAGIYFMKNLMLTIFTKLLLTIQSKIKLSLMFCFVSAFLSAFLDALTVTAVLIAVAVGFYTLYQENKSLLESDNLDQETEEFKRFLRNLLMHGAVGTALGGVSTIVGEPQNLLIGSVADWDFIEFFIRMLPVSLPVFIFGIFTCYLIEKLKIVGYGAELSPKIREIINDFGSKEDAQRTSSQKTKLVVQFLVALILIFALAFNVAAVGLIGLMVIVLLTAFNGITEEHKLGKAFEEALPFTALLVVFFVIVSVIHDQHLFSPVINYVLTLNFDLQVPMFFLANGILSMISDNVFVATIYISEVKNAFDAGVIDRNQFDLLAIAINTGTNLPSVATPNGQAAFLFLLTSSIAPLINLSYFRMIIMALPYTFVLTIVGLYSVIYFL